MTTKFTPSDEQIETMARAIRELLRNPPLVELKPKPTIDELEKRINAGTDGNFVIREDGSIWERQTVFSTDLARAAWAIAIPVIGEEAAKVAQAEADKQYALAIRTTEKSTLRLIHQSGQKSAAIIAAIIAAALRAKFTGDGE